MHVHVSPNDVSPNDACTLFNHVHYTPTEMLEAFPCAFLILQIGRSLPRQVGSNRFREFRRAANARLHNHVVAACLPT